MTEHNGENYSELFQPLADCPSMEQLMAETSSAEVRWHAASCPHCQSEMALFRNFSEAVPDRQEAGDVQWISQRLAQGGAERNWNAPVTLPERSVRAPWWKQLLAIRFATPAFAAAAAVLLVVGVVQMSRRPGAEPSIRISGDEPLRSRTLDVIGPVGELDQAPHRLSWHEVAGAARYDVRVMEVDRTDLWRTAITDTAIELPTDVRARLLPGKRVLWEVTARDAAGSEILDSGIKSFVTKIDGVK